MPRSADYGQQPVPAREPAVSTQPAAGTIFAADRPAGSDVAENRLHELRRIRPEGVREAATAMYSRTTKLTTDSRGIEAVTGRNDR